MSDEAVRVTAWWLIIIATATFWSVIVLYFLRVL
jgi:hypothetical protein